MKINNTNNTKPLNAKRIKFITCPYCHTCFHNQTFICPHCMVPITRTCHTKDCFNNVTGDVGTKCNDCKKDKFGFELIRSSDVYTDETAKYTVKLNRLYTFKTFLDEILLKKEWGSIEVVFSGDSVDKRGMKIDYKNDTTTMINFPFSDVNVLDVTAHGGWSMMNYKILLESK